jgi:serine/threonine-protein kinase
MTETGLSLGTPHYMSPEQATADKDISARSDIYSLASVLYEMLAGEPPHTGGSAQQVIMKIIAEPAKPVTSLRKSVPAHVEAALEQALEKLPADRFETVRAFSDALVNPKFTSTAASAARTARPATRGVALWLFGVVSCIAVASVLAASWALRRPTSTSPLPPMRFALELPDSQDITANVGTRALAISPDGAEIVYMGRSHRTRTLFRRRLDELTPHEIIGAAGALDPVFSPTGELAFDRSDRSLTTLPTDGRPSSRIVENAGRTSWGEGGVIAFIRGSSLWRTSSTGGPATRLTTPDSASGAGHSWPFVLPGGKAVLFNDFREARTPDELDVLVVRIADGQVKRLGIRGSNPRYVSSGQILVAQSDGAILAAPFDLQALELRGPPVRVLEGVFVRPGGVAQFDVSRNGVLAYVDGGETQRAVIVDRSGREHETGFPEGTYTHPRLSPTGDRVAVARSEGTKSDIWIAARGTGQIARFTRDGRSSAPEWSADGGKVGWLRSDSTGATIRWQRADGSGTPAVIPTAGLALFYFLFTPDGKSIVAVVGTPFHHDILLLPLDGSTKPRVLAGADADELQPSISPDGHWLAFTSNETGRTEVFAVNVDDPATRLQITSDGGQEPLWSGDGHSLIVRNGTSFVSIALTFSRGIAVTRRDTLFADPYTYGSPDRAADASLRTGEIVTLARSGSKRDRIVVVTNWLDELKRRMSQVKTP